MRSNARNSAAKGFAERSKGTRKISFSMPNDLFDQISSEAKSKGKSMASVVRDRVMAGEVVDVPSHTTGSDNEPA